MWKYKDVALVHVECTRFCLLIRTAPIGRWVRSLRLLGPFPFGLCQLRLTVTTKFSCDYVHETVRNSVATMELYEIQLRL